MARTTSGVMMSLGTVNMWGFSPSFDMQDGVASPHKEDTPLNLLLIGPGDIRHVLHTIAHRRRWGKQLRPINIYVYERSVETLARHMLLMQIAQDWELPLRQRVSTFLEVFGNTLVQERTSAYLEEKAKALIDSVHYERGWLANQFDLSHLKMKTRDELVDNFHSWFQKVRFDVVKLRDHRLRHYYEVRYDYRNNLIDWDYTMTLKKIENASVIHIRQYREWRNSGIAFEFGDQSYTEPNRSMAAFTEAHKKNHGSVLCRGLWADIIVSPYVSFGVDCETSNKFAEQLFEIHNKGTGVEQNRHNTTQVAVYNLLSYLHEIETGDVYKMKKAHDVYSGIGEAATSVSNQDDEKALPKIEEIDEEEETTGTSKNSDRVADAEARERAKTIVESLEGVKIIPLTGKLEDLYSKKRYHHLFDHVFLSSQHCHTLQSAPDSKEAPTFSNLLSDDALVSVESPLFLLPLTEDQRLLYMEKLVEMTTAHLLKPVSATPKSFDKSDLFKIQNASLRFQFTREHDGQTR
ncbi:hypothetical protein Poli38472_003397 [Pythium oligandrum]|uniref:Dynein assembly factor 3, axonemal n=1 Tax=Pythium oligandrum TaxID=41045 RepID=A0A8K1C6J5_PYTOL|nr:hypothetical protein Poli38472_003397 [Pythium oligandrum]|eukprot:TMW57472.1 hypothetical protein Poli38472_003397 [Pythium oligandrum]